MSRVPEPADRHFAIDRIDPDEPGSSDEREKIEEKTGKLLQRLYDLHSLMYADNRRALLIVLHGIDASGKDGTIRNLAAGLNPQGLKVHSFREPSAEELDHDYLWRAHRAMPGRGEVGIFNRSHYEEVSVVRVHRELLRAEQLPDEVLHDGGLFELRYRQINDFERILAENGTTILKFLLVVSRDEQLKRIHERMEDPKKHWKFSEKDLAERDYWQKYMKAFEAMVRHTSTEHAPWHAIPADRKWYRNHLITKIVVETLDRLDMKFPELRQSIRPL
jgi:PPK2 family polyphosphate:nucleotide phosphotransferase